MESDRYSYESDFRLDIKRGVKNFCAHRLIGLSHASVLSVYSIHVAARASDEQCPF